LTENLTVNKHILGRFLNPTQQVGDDSFFCDGTSCC